MQTVLSATIAMAAWAAAIIPGAASPDPLAAYRWKARLLLALAPSSDDPKLAQQRALFAAMGRDATERDLKLVVLTGAGGGAATLRTRFGLDDLGSHAVLVGKDGDDKLVADEPLGADRLVPLIDAMPMRQQEQRASAPKK